jgi:hypothetical protein
MNYYPLISSMKKSVALPASLMFFIDAGNTASYPGSGTSCQDLTTNAFVGTLLNGVGFSADGGGSFVFDGVDDKINFGNVVGLTNNFTFCLWVKIDDFSFYRGLLGKTSGASASPYDYYIDITSGKPLLYTGGTSFATVAPSTNTWVYLCVTQASNNINHYLNGATNGSFVGGSTVANGVTDLIIGSRGDGVTRMKGKIATVKIYNTVLTPAEILQNYNNEVGRY